MTSVVLAPMMSGIYQDDSLEPQMVTIRGNNNGNIILDSLNRSPGQPPNIFNIGQGTQFFGYRYKRLAFSKLAMFYNTPNVNQTNNVVQFNVGGTIYTAVIPELHYNFTALATALQTALNAAGSPATFTVTANTNTRNYTISSTLAYFFILTSPMVSRGLSLIALPQSQTPTTTKVTGQVMLMYSKSIYIISDSISQYTKNPSYKSGPGKLSFIASYDFTDNDYVINVGVTPGIYVSSDIAFPPRWINYDSSQSLTEVDIKLIDDYGNLFYIPELQNDGSPNPSQIILKFISEI